MPQPQHVGAARSLGVDRRPQMLHRRPDQAITQPAAGRGGGGLGDDPERAARDPFDQLERDVAGESVHHDDVGDTLEDLRPLDVADEVEPGTARPRELLVSRDEFRRALAGLLAVGQQRHPRGLDPEHRLGEGRAHVGELHQMFGTAGHVGADVEQQDRRAAGVGQRQRQRRPVHATIPPEVEQRGRQRRPGRAAGHECLGAAFGYRPSRLDDRRLGRCSHGVRGLGLLGDRDGSVHDLDPGGHGADLARRAEQHHPDALLGRPSSARRDLARAEVGSARVDGDCDHAGRPQAIRSSRSGTMTSRPL